MSSHTIQQHQQLHYSPLPPPFKFKSALLSLDSRLTSFCILLTEYYNHDPPYLQTTYKNESLTQSKTFLKSYIFALYHQEFNHFQNIQANVPFTQ